MEEKLILAVSSHPELYDSTSYFNRDRNKKDLAWKRVSEEIGQPEDFCRKKWKSLRDTYLKEKRKEMDKRSGSAAGSGKRWKYSQILGFLDPFVTPRETSGNMEGVEARIREDNHLEDQGQPGETAWETETEENDQRGEEDILRSLASSPVSPVPGPSAPAAELTGQQRRRARWRPRERSRDGPSEVEQTLLELLTQPPARPPTPPPRSADECLSPLRTPQKVVEKTRRLHTLLRNFWVDLDEAAVHPPL
ncbi:uncharacterized protein LOC127639764 [Xyrauchen texanus]|uniref:uncharacterized protein LOC127639764 n=1 Tax=Xyrauchen texanus TaxID=154827 RepID=UPI0022428A68|nr:uncharacterized protein LOC127639764 [Xyrauchen texanus]